MATTKTTTSKPESRAKSDENMWAMFCHLGGLVGFILPPANIILPLIIWLKYRDEYSLVDDQGKEAINFQISITIYAIASAILIFIAIGLFLLLGLGIFSLIVIVMAALRTSNGEKYRYPITIRFIQ